MTLRPQKLLKLPLDEDPFGFILLMEQKLLTVR